MAKNKKEIKELADLPYYREEYTAQLEKMGITDPARAPHRVKESKKKAEDHRGAGRRRRQDR